MNDEKRRRGARLERARASAQHKDGKFHNPSGAGPGIQNASSLSIMGQFFFKRGRREPPAPLPVERPHDTWARGVTTGLRVTWLGHSTVLLEMDGRRVLTDPVFGDRASPFSFAGPKRFHPVPARIEELPPLDAVLLSHDHFDHLCRSTMESLARTRVPIITALGVGAHLEEYGVDPAVASPSSTGTSTRRSRASASPRPPLSTSPAAASPAPTAPSGPPGSSSPPVERSSSPATRASSPRWPTSAHAHGPFDLVMLEVGAYHPAWGTIHLGPEGALTAFEMLGGGTLLPVHWGTFNLGLHDWDDPAETLLSLAAERRARVITPPVGLAVEPARVEGVTPWWRDFAP
jgi:L-ascorbate metabolism protein UlaG (beta-lactamase superfamily)